MKQEKIDELVRVAVAPLLEEEERVEYATLARVGKISLGRQIAKAVAVGILSGGTMTVYSRPTPLYLALTNRRLIFLEAGTLSGRPLSEISFALPREAVSVAESVPTRLMFIPVWRINLAVAGWDKGLQIVFQYGARTIGQSVGESLVGASV